MGAPRLTELARRGTHFTTADFLPAQPKDSVLALQLQNQLRIDETLHGLSSHKTERFCMATKKQSNRCWPGYEPVPGKSQHSQGSCKPKSESQLSPEEKRFRKARKQQLSRWKQAHPGSPLKAAQHLHAPKQKRRSARSK